MDNNMTALISLFARAYHYENSKPKVFSDFMAKNIITHEEYENISENMSRGISYFYPEFSGSKADALKWVVNNNLAPSTIARSRFAEDNLNDLLIDSNIEQYIIIASGYDTFGIRDEKWSRGLKVFEIDKKEMLQDKKNRISNIESINKSKSVYIDIDLSDDLLSRRLLEIEEYDKYNKSFVSVLGLSYYLENQNFKNLIKDISKLIKVGSYVCFDYPASLKSKKISIQRDKQKEMAKESGEDMISTFTKGDIENILDNSSFEIVKHLGSKEITDKYFSKYNETNDISLKAIEGINFVLAIKK